QFKKDLSMRLRATGVLTLAMAVTLLVGCTGSDSETPSEGAESSGSRRLITDDTLTVCVDAPKYPFAFQDQNGNWLGSDIEVVQAIANDLDLTLALVTAPFDGIWRAPGAGTCDLAAAAISITEER